MRSSSLPSGALEAYGWDESTQSRYQPCAGADRRPARVVRADRGSHLIATSEGLGRCYPAPTQMLGDSAAHTAATGDWVVVTRADAESFRLLAVLPRSSAIHRLDPDATGNQVLATNVDTVMALHGLDRPHRVGRLERLCILAWDGGAVPVVVLTKTDLAGSGGAVIDLAEAISEITRVVRGVEVIPVSGVTGEGIEGLDGYLRPATTVALMGESGAGKSTLINQLVGRRVQATATTRRGDNKGRHTTTSRQLLPLPSGAIVVDTPGVRTIGMTGNRAGLARAYDDVEALFAECRFRDCSHRVEPGCGVWAALSERRLSKERWAQYEKLQREMAHEARRVEQRKRGEERGHRRREGDEGWRRNRHDE